MLVATTTSTKLTTLVIAKMRKSINRARIFEFSSFLSIYHVENMSACLKENLGFFKFFTETDSSKQKRALLENITPSQLRALSEVCNHLLTKHCKLDIGTRKKLRKKADTLKRVVTRGRNYKQKKKVINQHGKGLVALLPLIASVVGDIFK